MNLADIAASITRGTARPSVARETDATVDGTVDTTVDVYDFWDRAFRRAGVLDYTEGFYDGDPTLSYEEAQHRQHVYLLDAVGCAAGSRILDIGCGNGTLLEEVRRRGGVGTGVTISPPQVQFCRERGLDVHLLNYRKLGDRWHGRFDAIVANGSIEHFVQPQDAVDGRAAAIYEELFAICRGLIDPQSASRRMITTTIHFGNVYVEPRSALQSPWAFRWFSDKFHYALLVRGFGGYYPEPGQLARCASPHFELVEQRDATWDYHLTSEAWLHNGRRFLWSPRAWSRFLPFMVRHPRHATRMLFLLLVAQSWNWQFRTERPPMQHLWQTWQC